MKTLLKFIAVVVLLAAVLIVAAPLLFKEQIVALFKDNVVAQVEKQTGRKLNLTGDIGLSVFPWLGLDVGALSLGNAPGFGDEPFLQSKHARVRVQLLPLLKKQLTLDTIAIDHLVLNLARDLAGKTNWEDLLTQKAPEEKKETGKPTRPGPALASLALAGVKVTDAEVRWNDRQANQRHVVRDLDLEVGAFTPDKPIPIDLAFNVNSPSMGVNGRVSLSGKAGLDLENKRYRLAPLNLQARLKGKAIPGGKTDLSLSTTAEADLKKQTAALSGLVLKVLGVEAKGDIHAQGILSDAPVLDGDLSFQGHGLNLQATAKANNILKSPQVNGHLKLVSLNPRDFLDQLGQTVPDTADPKALTHMAGDAAFSASGNSLTLSALKLALDETAIQGNLAVENFAKPALQFALKVDAIDLDRYLPPPKQGGKLAVATPGAAAGAAATLPVNTLRALNVKGRVEADKLTLAKVKLSNVVVQLDAHGGELKAIPNAQLYQGRYAGNIGLDARGGQPKLSLNESLTGIQVEPLLQDLTGKAKLSGQGDFSARLNATGRNANAFKRTLSGQGQFAFRDGALKGVNLGQLARQFKAGLGGAVEERAETDFSELTGTFMINQGVIHNDDLSAKSPLLRVQGQGDANLVTEKIDYTLNTSLVESSKGQGGKELEKLKGITIPIRVSGTFDKPKYTPDLAALAETQAKEQLDKRKEKVTRKVEEKLEKVLGKEKGKKVGEKLKDLLDLK
jgi:AsmA protein